MPSICSTQNCVRAPKVFPAHARQTPTWSRDLLVNPLGRRCTGCMWSSSLVHNTVPCMAFPFGGFILKTASFIFNIITFKTTNTYEGMAHLTTCGSISGHSMLSVPLFAPAPALECFPILPDGAKY